MLFVPCKIGAVIPEHWSLHREKNQHFHVSLVTLFAMYILLNGWLKYYEHIFTLTIGNNIAQHIASMASWTVAKWWSYLSGSSSLFITKFANYLDTPVTILEAFLQETNLEGDSLTWKRHTVACPRFTQHSQSTRPLGDPSIVNPSLVDKKNPSASAFA